MDLKVAMLLDVHSFGELELHKEYRGRGMYERTTAGVSGGHNDIFSAIAEIMETGSHADKSLLIEQLKKGFSTDSMGFGTIWY